MRQIRIGSQSFETIRSGNYFYVDKTSFIKEWWENGDDVTQITRPRRFGKTFNLDMLNCFFSNTFAGRGDLFEELEIWEDEKYRKLQGTYPVIFLSFANIKETNFENARIGIVRTLQYVFQNFRNQWGDDPEEEKERYSFMNISDSSSDVDICLSLNLLSGYLLYRYHKKVLILLDEYDTPLQEAYVNGYWDEMVSFMRSLFNSTFKTNPSLERALMTGITRVSKESIFSDLNNLAVVTTTSDQYETAFGFTQEEVTSALSEYGLSDQSDNVKKWYDGFTFGETPDIYNPWSILQFLKSKGKYMPYWANTSSNELISYELRVSPDSVKSQMEDLMNGGTLETAIDEQIIFSQLETNPEAIWSLFLASGYMKVVSHQFNGKRFIYTLALTNLEVQLMFEDLITQWFGTARDEYNEFMKSLIHGNDEDAQDYLEDVLMNTASFYDTGRTISKNEKPESFYHGLVLGMIAQEEDYRITSSRESGRGRYDIMMKPLKKNLPGILIEFKIFDPKQEKTLEDTAIRALKQIKEKAYDSELIQEGIRPDHIYYYGMGFTGKKVVIHKA